MQLDQKHLLVTGAAKRLARRFVERLLDAGAKNLKITGHYHTSKTEIAEVERLVTAKGHQFLAVAADLGKISQVQTMAKTAITKFGPIEVLINSASDFYPTPAKTCSEEDWDALHALNLKGQFFLAQAMANGLGDRKGVILNLLDVYAERSSRNFVAYAATKAGLWSITKNLAKEWAPQIRVNGVSPGPVLFPVDYTEEQKQNAIDRTLLKRAGTPDDIAHALLFLLKNEYITGYNLHVDGGRSLV